MMKTDALTIAAIVFVSGLLFSAAKVSELFKPAQHPPLQLVEQRDNTR